MTSLLRNIVGNFFCPKGRGRRLFSQNFFIMLNMLTFLV